MHADTLELKLDDDCAYGLSARRLWEHGELGQINVFSRAISARPELNDPAAFIDVIWFGAEDFWLVGFTLSDLRAGRVPDAGITADVPIPAELISGTKVLAFERAVYGFLDLCSARLAARNQEHPFLPRGQATDPLGLPLIFSSLQRRLRAMGAARADAQQWKKTIANFQQKGLRAQEMERSNLARELDRLAAAGTQVCAEELAGRCRFEELRLSVIPVIRDAHSQLRFISAPPRRLRRTKELPKPQPGQMRCAVQFDPVLGYRIEQVEHPTLWGADCHWQAVTHEGHVVRYVGGTSLLPTEQAAAELAAGHARMHFPKRVAIGQWGHYAWTGGQDYREWLLTLPHYPVSYFSRHFRVRNVLAHVRCDVREGPDGERVLLLQEVQSDWAQNARRAISAGVMDAGDAHCPPFLKEWPALTLKLMLLHAAHQNLDAVAWTRGTHQAERYKGLGETGLAELYDRTLPREANRMLKNFGCACELLGVFVPTNFRIRQSEGGYEVYSADNALLGTAPTLEDARQFVPDGGHEQLYEVHGVRLPAELRRGIMATGFPAWG